MTIGNVIYIVVELLPSNHRYWILVSRFVAGQYFNELAFNIEIALFVGFGSSNISLLKAYTAASSTPTTRSRSIAFVTGGIAIGMFLGPGI